MKWINKIHTQKKQFGISVKIGLVSLHKPEILSDYIKGRIIYRGCRRKESEEEDH